MEQRRTHETTSPTLLQRVRDSEDRTAWREFERCYSELIRRYCLRLGLRGADLDDVRQNVFLNLSKGLRAFEYDPSIGRFRHYLGRVVRNAIARHFSRKNPAKGALPLETEEFATSDPSDAIWQREWEDHHYRLAMETVRQQFEERSLIVFDELLQGALAETVASTHGMSVQAVHQVKHRIKTRLRELITAQVREEDGTSSSTN